MLNGLITTVIVNVVSLIYIGIISFFVVENQKLKADNEILKSVEKQHSDYLNELYSLCGK